jgi:hypothetical protein
MAKLFRLVRVRNCEEKNLYFQERSARIYALFHAGFRKFISRRILGMRNFRVRLGGKYGKEKGLL